MIHINKYIYAPPVVHQVKFISLNSHFQPDHLFKLIKPNSTSYLQQSKPGGTSHFRLHPPYAHMPSVPTEWRFRLHPQPCPCPPPSVPTVSRFRLHPQPCPCPPPSALCAYCIKIFAFTLTRIDAGYHDFRLQPTITLIVIRNSEKFNEKSSIHMRTSFVRLFSLFLYIFPVENALNDLSSISQSKLHTYICIHSYWSEIPKNLKKNH